MAVSLLIKVLIPIGYMPGNLIAGQPLIVPCPSYFGSLAYLSIDTESSSHHDHTQHLPPYPHASTDSEHSIDHSGHGKNDTGNQHCLFSALITAAWLSTTSPLVLPPVPPPSSESHYTEAPCCFYQNPKPPTRAPPITV